MWYQIKERGETKISFELNTKTTITVYTKGIFGKKKVTSFLASGKKNYSYSAFNNTTLLISVKPQRTARVKVKYDLNVDLKSSSKGGYWKPVNSPATTNIDICLAKYYIPAKSIPTLYYAISENKRLGYIDKAIDMAKNAAILYMTSKIKIPKKFLKYATWAAVAGTIYDIADPIPSFSFKDFYKSDIKKYSGLNASSTKATSGICLTVHMVDGFEIYTIKSWDGKTMKGEKGYKGTFKEFN